MNEIVRHSKLGEGLVVKIKDGIIKVRFGTEIKQFQFPQAFGTYLETEDKVLLARIDAANGLYVPKITKPIEAVPFAPVKTTPTVSQNSSCYKKPVTWSHNALIGERAQTIFVQSEEEMFEIIGYMARPGRVNSIEAEVPKDGRDEEFEMLFPGQTYRPIEMGYTPSGLPNKISPQFRINFGNIRNCPATLRDNMGKGNRSCVGRINKSKFVITIVQKYGFRFGDWQDREAIRNNAIKNGYGDAFDRGYAR